jgi:hypothetical protein
VSRRVAPDHEDVHPHSRPWRLATVVLSGGYEDVSPDGVDRLERGASRLRASDRLEALVNGESFEERGLDLAEEKEARQ